MAGCPTHREPRVPRPTPPPRMDRTSGERRHGTWDGRVGQVDRRTVAVHRRWVDWATPGSWGGGPTGCAAVTVLGTGRCHAQGRGRGSARGRGGVIGRGTDHEVHSPSRTPGVVFGSEPPPQRRSEVVPADTGSTPTLCTHNGQGLRDVSAHVSVGTGGTRRVGRVPDTQPLSPTCIPGIRPSWVPQSPSPVQR